MVKLSVIIALCCCSLLSLADGHLIDDLRDFKTLIPIYQIRTLGVEYFIRDRKFRTAALFLRSTDFANTMDEIRQKLKGSELDQYFDAHSSGHNLIEILFTIFKRNRSRTVPIDGATPRDFERFLDKVKTILPRSKFYNLALEKSKTSPEFAKLYKALRASEFKRLVLAARQLPELRSPIRKLGMKNINVDEIIAWCFDILSWGP